jgi:hypothetical protein
MLATVLIIIFVFATMVWVVCELYFGDADPIENVLFVAVVAMIMVSALVERYAGVKVRDDRTIQAIIDSQTARRSRLMSNPMSDPMWSRLQRAGRGSGRR